ncbi:hypothetical protein DMUE_3896 [Dictyocoela muelleri]|nr:hypothetical protein DMUE_3896 [Dictyocoela muelleri]
MEKIRDLKLVNLYKVFSDFRDKIRLLLSLYFVPTSDVTLCYEDLKNYITKYDKENHFHCVLSFFEKQYIFKNIKEIRFGNVYDRVLEDYPRTTNTLEGLHRRLNNLFIKAHPDIRKFGEELLKEHLFSKKNYSCLICKYKSG